MGDDAHPLLLRAASRLEPLDLDLARETYLNAWGAAMFAGRMADAGDLRKISRAARAAPAPAHPPRAVDLLLDGLALIVTDGLAAAAPAPRQAEAAFASADTPVEERLRWAWLATMAAEYLWDADGWLANTAQAVRLARDVGALNQLPISLQAQAGVITWCGDFPAAEALITETRLVCEATGTRMAPVAAMHLAALRGRESEAAPLIEATFAAATAGGQGTAVTFARWMTAHRPDRHQGQSGADPPGKPGRAACPRRPVQPRDRRPAIHQLPHRPVPPGQSVHQARHHLPRPARPSASSLTPLYPEWASHQAWLMFGLG
jgi:hypothetical protein